MLKSNSLHHSRVQYVAALAAGWMILFCTPAHAADADGDGLSDALESSDGGVVFVRKDATSGNLGGLSGADGLCNTEASAAGIGTDFTAWLSTSSVDARDRILDQGYRRVDDAVVATSLADLTDGSIATTISVSADGTVLAAGTVFTGSAGDGTKLSQVCNDWTDGGGVVQGQRGRLTDSVAGLWTTGVVGVCGIASRLYCFSAAGLLTDPNNPDSDGDGLCDGAVAVGGVCAAGEDLNGNGRIDAGETDPTLADTDGDGLSDGFEVANGFDPLDADEDSNGTVDSQDDFDSDGLGNAAEAMAGTDPNVPDTDDDGLLDGTELGTGLFTAEPAISTTADGAMSVVAADLDGDGDADVLAASISDTTIAWYENTDGQGTFSSAQVINASAFLGYRASAADLDGDGDADVLSGNSWYENTDGLGSFGTAQLVVSAAVFHSVAADVDGDGDLDVISDTNPSTLRWHENTDGGGTFGATHVIPGFHVNGLFQDNLRRTLVVADLDGDGDLDLLGHDVGDSGSAYWWENTDGQGTFGAGQFLVTPTPAFDGLSVVSADVDGDADQDAIYHGIGEVVWDENTDGLGTFGAQHPVDATGGGYQDLFAADVDGDGDVDVLSAAKNDIVSWHENTDGQGAFAAKQSITTTADGARSVHPADVDGDGDFDVLSASFDDDTIGWYRQTNVSDPLDEDTDDDGLLDGFEVDFGFDPKVPGEESLDTDGDGLTNLEEQTAGSSPLLEDTDSDGFDDLAEVNAGTDPADPLDFPGAPVPALPPAALVLLGAALCLAGRVAAARSARGKSGCRGA